MVVAADNGFPHLFDRSGPDAERGHQTEQPCQQLIAVGGRQPVANPHLHHQGRSVQRIQTVSQGGFSTVAAAWTQMKSIFRSMAMGTRRWAVLTLTRTWGISCR